MAARTLGDAALTLGLPVGEARRELKRLVDAALRDGRRRRLTLSEYDRAPSPGSSWGRPPRGSTGTPPAIASHSARCRCPVCAQTRRARPTSYV